MATYWCEPAPAGNDGNPGTYASPWATFQKAADTAVAGDTVIFKDGTYTLGNGDDVDTNSGTSGNLITFQAENEQLAVFNYDNTANTKVRIAGMSYLQFVDLVIDGGDGSAGGECIRVRDGGHHITFDNCIIRDTAGHALRIYGTNPTVITVQDCDISMNNITGTSRDGINIDRASNVTISGCTIHHVDHNCINFYQATDCEVTNCILHDADSHCITPGTGSNAILIHDCLMYDTGWAADAHHGVFIAGDGQVNIYVYRNVIRDMPYAAIYVRDDPVGPIYIWNNTLQGNCTADATDGAFRAFNCTVTTPIVMFYNNIIYSIGERAIAIVLSGGVFNDDNYALNHNDYYSSGAQTVFWKGTTYATFAAYVASADSDESDSLAQIDPLFTNLAGDVFTLQDTSPCIDAGWYGGAMGGHIVYSGDAPDMGAFEWSGESPPEPPPPPSSPLGTTAAGPYPPVLGAPPYTPTSHEMAGLSIMAYKPQIGSYAPRGALVDDLLGQKFTAYTHTIQADGGWWSARLTLDGKRVDAEEWFESGLGRHVEVWNPALVEVWEGFVNQVTASTGTLTATRGPLLDIANRASVTYTPILDATADPPVTGTQTTTAIEEDDDSQARYGIVEKVVSGGQLLDDGTTDLAEVWQDTYLAENAWPRTTEELGIGSTASPSVELELLGYVHWLGAYILDDPTAQTVEVSDDDGTGKLQLIIAADPNDLFSTDYTDTDDNPLLTSRYEGDNRDAWSAIKELVALGDAANNRWTFGVYARRRCRYRAVPTAVKYQHRIGARDMVIEPFGGGPEVRPWDVQAGQWVFLPDWLVGRSQPTERRRDPRYLFIESVTYTAPYGLQIRGGTTDTLAQLMAKGGLWG